MDFKCSIKDRIKYQWIIESRLKLLKINPNMRRSLKLPKSRKTSTVLVCRIEENIELSENNPKFLQIVKSYLVKVI